MIEKVEIHNFKSLRNVSLDLERFTVLVGPNASGKTSVLEALELLITAPQKMDRQWKSIQDRLRLLISAGSDGEMTLTCSSDRAMLQLATRHAANDIQPLQESGRCFAGQTIDLAGNFGKTNLQLQRTGDLVSDMGCLGPVRLFRPIIDSLTAPSYSDEPKPKLEADGAGLPSVLSYMSSDRPDDYEAIMESLHEIIPTVRKLRFPRARIVRLEEEAITHEGKTFTRQSEREYWGHSIEFDMTGASGIPATMASEGTLLVLGILTAIMGPERPRLLLVDDIDRALHPKAQEELVALLRKLLECNPHLQIVATSHSPYLLDHFRPEEVRLTTLREDGSVACGRLDQHPDFDKWKEQMSPGEFWSLIGEHWLVESGAGEPV